MGYSDKYLGAIRIELTMLTTLRITEDSAKQLVNSLLFTEICMIRLLREGNVSYVSPAKAGLDDFVFYDFRHVEISNLRKAGNSPTVIMKASGHKTMSIFLRYNLVDEEDFD